MTAPHKTSDQETDFETTIAQHIKGLRIALKISAVELDRLADFSTGTTERLECKDQSVYASHIYRMCQATGVGIDYFYGSGTENTALSSPEAQEKQRLLNAYMHIQDTATKRNVFELIETIANEYEGHPEK